MFQLQLMDPNRYVGVFEVHQPARMVNVQVSHDNRFDVLNVMTGFGNGFVQLLVLCISNAFEEITQLPGPYGVVFWATTGLE